MRLPCRGRIRPDRRRYSIGVGHVVDVDAQVDAIVEIIFEEHVAHGIGWKRLGIGEAVGGLGEHGRRVGLPPVHPALVLHGRAHRELFRHLVSRLERGLEIGEVGHGLADVGGPQRPLRGTDPDIGRFQNFSAHHGQAALDRPFGGQVPRDLRLEPAHADLSGVEGAGGGIVGTFHHVRLGGLEQCRGQQEPLLEQVQLGAQLQVDRSLGLCAGRVTIEHLSLIHI